MTNTLSNTQKTGLAIAGAVAVLFAAAAIASPVEASQSAATDQAATALVSSSGEPAEPGDVAHAESAERGEIGQAEPAERGDVARA